MRLLLRLMPGAALRASADAWGMAIGVSATQLLMVRSHWWGRGSIQRIPLRQIDAIELHARVHVSRLHVEIGERHLVVLYDTAREAEFERIVEWARQLGRRASYRPRFVSRVVLQGGHLRVCGRTS